MSHFTVEPLLPMGPARVVRHAINDSRGSFARIFCAKELAAAGWPGPVAQANLSFTTTKGSVRGMHFQHTPEAKLVVCLSGSVWDVAVDLRTGTHVATELSSGNDTAMLIPPGFAHGFQTMTDDARLLYFHSTPHDAQAEGGLNPFDPALAIDWPMPVTIVSDRDRGWPMKDISV